MKYFIIAGLIFWGINSTLQAQCATYEGSPRKEEALDAYSVYVTALKQEDYALAYDNWKIAYEIAPCWDGIKPYNFTSGIDILVNLYKKETDKAKKKELKDKIMSIYDDYYGCYASKSMKIKGCNTDSCYNIKLGNILADKAYNMFYDLQSPYSKLKKVLDEATQKAGLHSPYNVIVPYGSLAVYQYEKGKMAAAEARRIHQLVHDIAQYNVNNKDEYAQYYTDAVAYVDKLYKKIEGDIYDCSYFEKKFRPKFEADPENTENLKFMIAKMKSVGCDPNGSALLKQLEEKWSQYATAENSKIRAEYEAKNPHIAAKRLYDEGIEAEKQGQGSTANGKFKEAIAKYRLAIENATDEEAKSKYYFSIASIQFRKLKQYNAARATARKAASLNKNWGRPYMLIGDMYASTARNCGDSWMQRLAILAAIDKYAYGRSIDPGVSSEANKKIGRYNALRPDKSEGFMRKIKEGTKQKVGCWIGETVTVRYK